MTNMQLTLTYSKQTAVVLNHEIQTEDTLTSQQRQASQLAANKKETQEN